MPQTCSLCRAKSIQLHCNIVNNSICSETKDTVPLLYFRYPAHIPVQNLPAHSNRAAHYLNKITAALNINISYAFLQ